MPSQPIALTYDLFKAVKELERGMSIASLSRTVLALLDTARARLSGPIVRDREILDRARICIGNSGVVIEERRHGFASHRHGGRTDDTCELPARIRGRPRIVPTPPRR